jgi:hypothetical protein
LDFNRAVHCVNDAAEFYDASVARALDDAAVMHRDSRVDQVAAKGPQAGEDTILVRACEAAISDDVRDEDRRELSGLAQFAPSSRTIGAKKFTASRRAA